MSNEYRDALIHIRNNPGTGSAYGLAKLIMSLADANVGFGLRDCIGSFDGKVRELAAAMVGRFMAGRNDDAELTEVANIVRVMNPDLRTEAEAMRAAVDELRGLQPRRVLGGGMSLSQLDRLDEYAQRLIDNPADGSYGVLSHRRAPVRAAGGKPGGSPGRLWRHDPRSAVAPRLAGYESAGRALGAPALHACHHASEGSIMSQQFVFCHLSDSHIDREHTPGVARLEDEEGMLLHTFPGTMTDREIREVLTFANRVYAAGGRAGMSLRSAEFRKLLEIPEGAPSE